MKLNINMAQYGFVAVSSMGMIVSIVYITLKIHGLL